MRTIRLMRGEPPLAGDPPERLLLDEAIRCPYLPGQTARLPLRLPARRLRPREFSQRLSAGDRRQGFLLYRPTCGSCHACEAIRIDVQAFAPNKTQRRIVRRGDAVLQTELAASTFSHEKVALYNLHKIERGLLTSDGLIDADGYQQFLVDTCTDTLELTYRHNGKLIGVAVADRAADALSAVYCFYDPAFGHLSPGVYSILKQLELCHAWGLRYLYLGLYVANCPSMAYKARYLPHERLIDGEWVGFSR